MNVLPIKDNPASDQDNFKEIHAQQNKISPLQESFIILYKQ